MPESISVPSSDSFENTGSQMGLADKKIFSDQLNTPFRSSWKLLGINTIMCDEWDYFVGFRHETNDFKKGSLACHKKNFTVILVVDVLVHCTNVQMYKCHDTIIATVQMTLEASLFSAAGAFWTLPIFLLVATEVSETWEQPQNPLPLPRFSPTPATTGEKRSINIFNWLKNICCYLLMKQDDFRVTLDNFWWKLLFKTYYSPNWISLWRN